jgi:predicted TIM-barrel enzyme
MRIPREESLKRLRQSVSDGKPIVGGGAGTGLSAKCAEMGNIDLIIIYLAGVCGTDPFREMPVFLKQVTEIGFSGVQNFPTVGLIDGVMRQNLEETGMSYDLEVEMIRLAHEMDLLTCPYVFNEDEAAKMAEAGADVLVPHMGLTTKGSIGATTALTLEESAKRVQSMHDAAREVNPEILVLCHGGPIAEPEDAQYILENTTGVVGFFGASSIERLPTEVAITEQVRSFKSMRV